MKVDRRVQGRIAWVLFGIGVVLAAVGAAWMAGGPPASLIVVGVVLVVAAGAIGVAKVTDETADKPRRDD